MLATLFTALTFIIIIGYAFARGGGPERAGAAALTCMVVLSAARPLIFGIQKVTLDIPGYSVDLIVFAGLVWIALFAWRIWPLWAAALQLLAVSAHMLRSLDVQLEPLIYDYMRTAPTQLLFLVLLWGTINHHLRTRAKANWPSWRGWSEQLNRFAPSRLLG